MSQTDVNRLFAQAQQAYIAGRLDTAQTCLAQVLRLVGDQAVVLQLLGLVEKKIGNLERARRAFERAVSIGPVDAQLAGNFANLLYEMGQSQEALNYYGKALALNPDFKDARFNRAVLLHKLGRLQEALVDLERLGSVSRDGKVHSLRGSVLRELGRLEESASAYDSALKSEPERLSALRGRARVALELGERGASTFYERALLQKPRDLELVLGLAEALEAKGDSRGMELLAHAIEDAPDWLVGHEVLARMRSEAGEYDQFADHYQRTLAARPGDRDLHYSYWRSLALGGKHKEALSALSDAYSSLLPDNEMRLMEAIFTSEAGDPNRAMALLDEAELPERPDIWFARARIALAAGDLERSASLFEEITTVRPEAISAWAHLSLCWRILGDSREEWLLGQERLYGTQQLDLSGAELGQLADLLRHLHTKRAHPIGQSLRGGTQTPGHLLGRKQPELSRLREALEQAVREHFAHLPARDERHPLLRHRDATPSIERSWSVRLTSQGFHVNHIHPEGILSSAFYVSLPPGMGDGHGREGWLELGRPPAELGLMLEPLACIEPKPGLLALFPSYLFHGTRPFARGERLTVAFDCLPR